MPGPHDDMRFSRIETRATMPNGKVVTTWHSYPLGVGKDEYDRIDAALVRIYGNDNCRTIGTPMGHPDSTFEATDRNYPDPAPATTPKVQAGMVVVVGIDILEFGDIQASETFSINRTIEGAAREVAAYVDEQLERRSMNLSDTERDALIGHISTRDGINLADGGPDEVAGIDRGRMLEIAGILNSTFGLRVQELGA